MKRVLKGDQPASLGAYLHAQPEASWDELRDDAQHGGKQAYTDIRDKTHEDSGGLCAYCEIDIRDNDPLKSHIEHFHPKSDRSSATNWALAWGNMFAVCAGGSYRHGAAPYTMEPLTKNLSCDAHKDKLIQRGCLVATCEGWVLNPLDLQAWPSLLEINKLNGQLRASKTNCAMAKPWPNIKHEDTTALVEYTIAALNLNCSRLCQARLVVVHDIERNKKRQRLAGCTPQQGLSNLVLRYLNKPWPGFFTTICLCLGSAADKHMENIGYQG